MQTRRELRAPEQVEAWLCAGLCLMRLSRPSVESLPHVIPWVRASLEATAGLPPAGVIADVGRLLERGKLEALETLPVGEPRLRAAMQAYGEHVLGRLAAEGRFEAACDALARLPEDVRAEGVALLVEQLLVHMRYPEATALSPGVARRILLRPVGEIVELGLAELRREGTLLGLAPSYEQLVHRARHTDVLLTDKDLFTLEHLLVLRSLTQRVAIQQMVDAAEALERGLPRRLRPRWRRQGGTPTRVEDESAYPTGGFASLTNAGSLENILCSELVYMDEGEAFDLFDVRFAEGELLYYTRDDSVFLRNRRVITFLLFPDLDRARFKDADLPWQRLVLVLGLLVCTIRRLSDWLTSEALCFRVVFVDRGSAFSLEEELGLCGLLLREWIEKGTVVLSRAREEQALAGDESSVVSISTLATRETALPGRREAARRVSLLVGRRPTVVASGLVAVEPPRRTSRLALWTDATRTLLEELL